MTSPSPPTHRFALLHNKIILIPTPTAISIPAYRKMYASLHANPAFCTMAFGEHFPARVWSDAETHESIHTRDVIRCWGRRGMGDFAVGVYTHTNTLSDGTQDTGRILTPTDQRDNEVRVVDGDAWFDGKFLESITWIGYAGVRDATTTSMPARESGDAALPPWEEMVELRYGVVPEYWGKGVAAKAAEMVMLWAVRERGVRRFIAETERENVRSGRVLEKMGFVLLSGTEYWKEPSEVEWERVVLSP
ncbi:GNAT domain-containing protein [Aspergillus californicus]